MNRAKEFIFYILLLVVGMALIWLVVGCKGEAEATYMTVKDGADISWYFEGTYCPECAILYNMTKPKICGECGTQTKDFYYLGKIEDRK